MKTSIGILALLVLTSSVTSAHARVIVYDGTPIAIEIAKDSDVVVKFQEPQRVGTPPNTPISAKPAGNFVTLTSGGDVANKEIVFQGLDSGKVVYARLKTVEENRQADDEITIKFADAKEKNNIAEATVSGLDPRETAVALGRIAAQIHGPKYAIEDAPFTFRTTALRREVIPGLYRAAGVLVSPMLTVEAQGIRATQFLVENKSDESLVIEPQKFRGKWFAMDVAAGDAVVRAKGRTIVTLFHTKPLPTDPVALIYGE